LISDPMSMGAGAESGVNSGAWQERLLGESFRTLRTAAFAEVLRGVSFTPGSR